MNRINPVHFLIITFSYNAFIKTYNYFFYFFLIRTQSYGQTVNDILKERINALQRYTSTNPTEKLYLQLDRQWYTPGDTIWFKAYAVQGPAHQPSEISKVLYAELIGNKDSVLKRLTLPLNPGISWGDFELPVSYKAGMYRLRAYTNWMRNDSTTFFERQIIVGRIEPDAEATAATKPNTTTTNLPQKSSSPAIDVQFFPESGYLVSGLRSKVAVKAIDHNGNSVAIHGTITDADHNEITTFNTQYAGMAQFAFTPQQGKHYRARITTANGGQMNIDLPAVIAQGMVLTVNDAGPDSIYLSVAANKDFTDQHKNSPVYVIGQSAGIVYYTAAARMNGKVFAAAISKKRFPTGITQFTLFSKSGEPMNERIIFINNADQLDLKLNAQNTYPRNKQINMELSARTVNGIPVLGSFSVSVTDEEKAPANEQGENTIMTDLLLTSELKGRVETPNYYFINLTDKTNADLDLLMLTQGYRRYEWNKILAGDKPQPLYPAETSLSLQGMVKTPSGAPILNGKVRISSVKDFFVADTLTDANGHFKFDNVDLPDSTKIVINAKNAKGNDNVKISVMQKQYPAVYPVKDEINFFTDSLPEAAKRLAQQAFLKAQKQSKQDLTKRTIQLKEVKIKGSAKGTYFQPVYSDNMKLSSNLNGPGNADEVILAENIQTSGTLAQVLPARTTFLTWQNGLPYAGSKPMTVIVDGVFVNAKDLDDISIEDVYSVEVLRHKAYTAIYGSNAPNGALIITLKHGSGTVLIKKKPANGLITYNFRGYYKSRVFYSSVFDKNENKPVIDIGATIYWNPNLVTDKDGKTSFNYFTPNVKGNYKVVIEGIDGEGRLGRIVYRYTTE